MKKMPATMNMSNRITSKLARGLPIDRIRRSHTQYHGLNGQQATRLQGVTAQGESQCKNELPDQEPAGNKRSGGGQQDGVDQQESDNGFLVPVG